MEQEAITDLSDPGLAGKNVLVTGAAGEIGLAITRHFVAAGARVLMVDYAAEALNTAVGEFGDAVAGCVANVADADDMAAAVETIVSTFGGLDVAVLNAGIEGTVSNISDYENDEFDRVMAVNVRGVWLGMKYAVAAMKPQQRGSIVAMASAAGVVGAVKCAPYVASKHAVIGLVRSVAADVSREGIRVNAVAPGQVEGRMVQSLESGYMPDDPARARRSMERGLPLGRYGKAKEIAAVVAFLASDAARFCTGSVYAADGGMTGIR